MHYAIVELGGYVRYHDITAQQRRSMFTQERGNMMALNTIWSETRGFDRGGDDTDPPMEDESQRNTMEVDENGGE